jgi:CO/xanthine dehydrogenase FAD-binding subunit
MQDFSYVAAKSIGEVASILSQEGDNARILSGGTDIIVQLREGRRKAGVVIDVKAIPELNQLSFDPQRGLTIGAAVPCHRIYGNADIAAAYPGLIDSVTLIGGTAIQGRATLGGNVGTASPAGDSIPTLIAHGAVCLIAAKNVTREIPVEKLFAGPGRTVLQPGELMTAFRLPAPRPRSAGAYLRFIPRNEMDIAVASAGVMITLDATGQTVTDARIAIGAVAPTVLLVPGAATALIGKPLSDATLDAAGEAAKAMANPITDMRGTIEQRKHLTAVMTRRAIEQAVARIQAA